MRKLWISLFFAASTQLAHAECIDMSKVPKNQALEIRFNHKIDKYTSRSLQKINQSNGYVFNINEISIKEGRKDTHYDLRSIMGIYTMRAVKTDAEPSKSIMYTTKFNLSEAVVGKKISDGENVSFIITRANGNFWGNLRGSMSSNLKMRDVYSKFKVTIAKTGESEFILNNCKIKTNIFEVSELFFESNSEAHREHHSDGKPRKQRFHFANSLMYPIRVDNFVDGKWVEDQAATSIRVVR